MSDVQYLWAYTHYPACHFVYWPPLGILLELLHHACRTFMFQPPRQPPSFLDRCLSAAIGATAIPALQCCSAAP